MISDAQRHDLINWIQEHLQHDEIALPIACREFLASDWALTFESTPEAYRKQLWQITAEEQRPAILAAMRDETRKEVVRLLDIDDVVSTVSQATPNQIIDVINQLPKATQSQVLQTMPKSEKALVLDAMDYSTNQIGRYATQDFANADLSMSVAEILQKVAEKDHAFVYFTDSVGKYQGRIKSSKLSQKTKSAKLTEDDLEKLEAIVDDENINTLGMSFKRFKSAQLAVITEDNELIGVFNSTEAIVHIESYYESKLAHSGNVSDEDLFAPVAVSARQRAVWLGINLLTAILAAWVIGLFEHALEQLVALAVLMPIVASMGGIAGSQTLTLTIRGLATHQLSSSNINLLRNKEFYVVAINATVWALAVAAVAYFWFDQIGLAVVIMLAIFVNMLVAVMSGIAIPYLMDKVKIDPALAGSVVLTTVSDVVGFFVFLGCASLFLL